MPFNSDASTPSCFVESRGERSAPERRRTRDSVPSRGRRSLLGNGAVLLADGNTRSGLAVARSLSRRGVRVVLLAERPRGITASSRSVERTLYTPNVLKHSEGFIEILADTAARQSFDLLIPISDGALYVLDRFRDEISGHAPLAMPCSAAVRSVLDKRRNLEIARRVGVPCARQVDLAGLHEFSELVRQLGFPMILKGPGLTPDRAHQARERKPLAPR